MKKLKILSLSAAFLVCFSAQAFADEIQGMVDSINLASSTIVVKDPVNGAGRTLRVHPKVLPSLKNGVIIKAVLKPGSNDTAETLQVLTAE